MVDHTLVVRFSSLGDVVLAGAVTGALAPVTFLTKPAWREVAERLPGVARVLCWGEDELPRSGWKRVVDLHASPRSRVLRVAGPVSRVARYDLRRRLRVWLKVGAPPPTVVERYAAAAGVEPAQEPWVRRESGVRDALLLCPGAAHAPKRWPLVSYSALAARWQGPVIVLGSAAEARLCAEVGAEVGAEVVAEDGFAGTFAALDRAAACVAGDTGLMHLAAASGVPTVALFGPTTSSDGFWVHQGVALETPLSCRPCSLHGGEHCPIGDHRCMESLSVDLVWEALEALRH